MRAMGLWNKLMSKSKNELINELNRSTEQNKSMHDTAALMGSIGVSPKHASMYFDSMKVLNEYKLKK